jgi:hypothetical protein
MQLVIENYLPEEQRAALAAERAALLEEAQVKKSLEKNEAAELEMNASDAAAKHADAVADLKEFLSASISGKLDELKTSMMKVQSSQEGNLVQKMKALDAGTDGKPATKGKK